MRLTILVILLLFLLIPTTGGALDNKVVVAVSVPSLSYIVKSVLGDYAEIVVIVPEGVDPHLIQFSPDLLSKVSNAELLVLTGHLPFEQKLCQEVDPQRCLTLKDYLKEGAVLLKLPSGELNLHAYWLHPKNALAIASALCKRISILHPELKDFCETSLAKFMDDVQQFLKSSSSIMRVRQMVNCPVLVVFPAEMYIANAFNLTVAEVLVEGELAPSAEKLSKISEMVEKGEIQFIIASDVSMYTKAGEYAEGFARDHGVALVRVAVLSGAFSDYFDLMYYNLGAITSSYLKNSSKSYSDFSLVLVPILVVIASIAAAESFILWGRKS